MASSACIKPIGSIPAWAGETACFWDASAGAWVYPRVGGGNNSLVRLGVPSQGLSPRGRGKRPLFLPSAFFRGSIPAWAGETHPLRPLYHVGKVYPRVGEGNRDCIAAD